VTDAHVSNPCWRIAGIRDSEPKCDFVKSSEPFLSWPCYGNLINVYSRGVVGDRDVGALGQHQGIGARLRSVSGADSNGESNNGGDHLSGTDQYQPEGQSRYEIRRLSDTVIRRVLALFSVALALLLFGAYLWGNNGDVYRRCGWALIFVGATLFGGSGLWLFGWL
jgi:hypothetical protein